MLGLSHAPDSSSGSASQEVSETENAWLADPQPALLVDSLEVLRLQSRLLGRASFDRSWSIRFLPEYGWFHGIGAPCVLQQGETRLKLAPNDLIIVFPGSEHRLFTQNATLCWPIRDAQSLFRTERGETFGTSTPSRPGSLVTGCFLLQDLERTPLYASLPPFIRIAGRASQPTRYVSHLLGLMMGEASLREPSSSLIVNRLVRLLLIKAVQHYMRTTEGQTGQWLLAIKDPQISRALAMMHDHPDAPWTFASLARRVSMSRSVFSARFTSLVGKPPLEYLCEWRMQKAAYLLRKTRGELKEVAALVGYDSASAFSKAFTRWSGTSPGSYRAATRAENEKDAPGSVEPGAPRTDDRVGGA